ncbi:MAG: N-6 DNA methylase [Byssovorax sp.]
MAKRHVLRPGSWESAALRLDEILCAHSGEDPFEEALKLLVARLAHEAAGEPGERFLAGGEGAAQELDRRLAEALGRWPGIVEEGSRTRLRAPEIERAAEVVRPLRLIDDQLVGLDAIFEGIVSRAAKGRKGQYFTPRHVIAEIVAMIAPRAGEHVADPACGSGGFLRHALMPAPGCEVGGFDQDPRAVRVARAMIAASGRPASRIVCADSLLRAAGAPKGRTIEASMRAVDRGFSGFDLILTNPPFAGDLGSTPARGYELARGGAVERDVLFLERCVGLLRPGGRLAIVLPYNKVGAARWAEVRRWLLSRVRVAAVLGLGRNTFQPHTSQKACVILGIKRRTPAAGIGELGDEEIVFFVSDRDGKDARGRLLVRAGVREIDHDLGEAAEAVRAHLARAVEEVG